MKIIITAPVKNEEWILPSTLRNFSSFADHIILADQSSSDRTIEICKMFKKVKVIHNPFKGYTNEVRFMLLDEARRIEGEKLIICLDADEQISPIFIDEIKSHVSKLDRSKTIGFFSDWLQIYGSYSTYRTDYPWKNNHKLFAFIDAPSIDYNRSMITNEHIPRIPNTDYTVKLTTPILHLQWLAQKRSEIKQALYMCTERIDGWDPRRTNNRYSITKFIENPSLEHVRPEWLKEIYFPSKQEQEKYDEIKLQNILAMFKEKGSAHFEALDIWHIPELREYFIGENNREPYKILVFPWWLIKLNNIKNRMRYRSIYFLGKIKLKL